MVSDSFPQARQLFLAEALELCQQVKEGLLILVHAPTPLTYQKLVRRVQSLHHGAHSLGLTDIELWADGLGSLLEACGEPSEQVSRVYELLHHLCDGLQLSLIAHNSVAEPSTALSQREFVLHSLVPKVLEVFEAVSTQPLPGQLQSRLLLQQVQWMQFWCGSLDLSELKTLLDATFTAFEAFPDAGIADAWCVAIAPLALAGFQVAYELTIQRLAMQDIGFTALDRQPMPQRPLCPSEQALDVFKTEQYLVGLAHQTIFCVATQSIEEIAVFEPSQLRYEDGRTQILWRDRLLTLHQYTDLWQPLDSSTLSGKEPKDSTLLLILKDESKLLAVALEVDRLIVEPELKLERSDGEASHSCCYGMATLEERLQVVDVNCLLSERLAKYAQATSQKPVESTVRALSFPQLKIATPQPKPLPQRTISQRTILIVDDSRVVREMLTLTLQGAGYSVLQAHDGRQAIEHLQHQTDIHLTICDIEMSNLNGFEFLRHRLQDPLWSHIPVLILSSHTDPEYRQLAQKLGAADYFTIPYEDAALIQSIENLL
jgi:CheY-like chemotaxis protein